MVAIAVVAIPLTRVAGSPALKVSRVCGCHGTPAFFWIRSITSWAVSGACWPTNGGPARAAAPASRAKCLLESANLLMPVTCALYSVRQSVVTRNPVRSRHRASAYSVAPLFDCHTRSLAWQAGVLVTYRRVLNRFVADQSRDSPMRGCERCRVPTSVNAARTSACATGLWPCAPPL
jgi:hypothetical protein